MSENYEYRNLTKFGDLFEPREAIEPILSRAVRGALLEWITEIFAEDELKAVGIAPRKRAMFSGPPGVGKTTLAHHLAARLGLKMLAIRPDRLISKWLGETGQNVGDLFIAVAALDEPVVLFFDEFDAIAAARTRADQAATRETNATVDVLLQRVEQHDGFLIAATNHPEGVDPAIWRRFDMQIRLELPGQSERERIIARYLAPYGLGSDVTARIAEALDCASPALIRQFCEGVKRQIVLGERLGWDMRKAQTIDRIVEAVHPHPDAGKPRLWSHGGRDVSVKAMAWPLRLAADMAAEPETPPTPSDVVPFPSRKAAQP